MTECCYEKEGGSQHEKDEFSGLPDAVKNEVLQIGVEGVSQSH